MVYKSRYLVIPHVQTVQNMYGKGRKRGSKAELQPAEVAPYFKREKIPQAVFLQIRQPQF